MLVNVLVGVLGVVLVFVAVVATRPSLYRVERTLEVTAPVEVVFGILNDLHRFARVFVLFGTPLEKRDPEMQKTFEGPPSGPGQSFAWSGKEAGEGKLRIEKSVPGQAVVISLEFVKPMASQAMCTFSFAGRPDGTLVTWSMEGKHNFLGRAFGVFLNMDRMLGKDLEKGLTELKAAAEASRQH